MALLSGGGLLAATVTSGVTGMGTAFDNRQASLPLNYQINLSGTFPSMGGGGAAHGHLGFIEAFAGNFDPAASTDGQVLSIASNTALFSLVGTQYGGNGTTDYALPDLRGRAMVGAAGTPGAQAGTESTTLTVATVSYTHLTLPTT